MPCDSTITSPHDNFLLPELLYHVMDHCVDESTTLCSSSLVSQAWRRAAQRQLISHVTVFTAVPSRCLHSFIMFLNRRVDIRSAIGTLTIKPHPPRAPVGELLDTTVLKVYELGAALALLPRLNSLSILAVNILPDTPLLRSGICNSAIANAHPEPIPATRLRTLRLWTSCIYRVGSRKESLLAFLVLFVSIDTLCVDSVWFAQTDTPWRTQHSHPFTISRVPRVHALEFGCSISDFASECNVSPSKTWPLCA